MVKICFEYLRKTINKSFHNTVDEQYECHFLAKIFPGTYALNLILIIDNLSREKERNLVISNSKHIDLLGIFDQFKRKRMQKAINERENDE